MSENFEKNKIALQFTKQHVESMRNFSQMLLGCGIKHFHYNKVFKDGRYVHFVDDEEYAEFFTNEIDDVPAVFENAYHQNFREFIWPQKKLEGFLLKLQNYKICNGFSLARFYENYYEAWSFSTDSENTDIINTYVNKIDELKCFSVYFNNIFASVVKEAEKTPGQFKNYNFAHQNYWEGANTSALNLPFVVNEQPVYLTFRELGCLQLVSEGLSMKEIAKKLNLSSRTVEFYLNNVKQKLSVTTKSKAISIYNSQKRLKW